MKSIKGFEWALHATIVISGLLLLNQSSFDLTFGMFRSGDGSLLWPSIIGTVINLILFYTIALYLIPDTLKKRGVMYFLGWLTVLFILASGFETLIDAGFYRVSHESLNGDVWSELVVMVVFTHIMVVVVAFAYRFSRDWFANEHLRRSINEHQLRSELEVLKSQINPHFLFNALNNLFSMALQSGDEKTAEGINKLSEMMRYVLEKTSEDKVSLEEEIQYIVDYNYLQLLRFNEQVEVQFDYPGSGLNYQIAPMLLIPFVENAFKYGVSSKGSTKIDISIAVDEEVFVFVIANQKAESHETVPSTGVGLQNVRKRLNLVYPDRHKLMISDHGNNYKVTLTISNK